MGALGKVFSRPMILFGPQQSSSGELACYEYISNQKSKSPAVILLKFQYLLKNVGISQKCLGGLPLPPPLHPRPIIYLPFCCSQ